MCGLLTSLSLACPSVRYLAFKLCFYIGFQSNEKHDSVDTFGRHKDDTMYLLLHFVKSTIANFDTKFAGFEIVVCFQMKNFEQRLLWLHIVVIHNFFW